VRRVEIPKDGGGTRQLGIPTVVDRFIQQAVLQVLQPLFDPTFSTSSYGYRPGRSAHQAVKAAQQIIQSGRDVAVELTGSSLIESTTTCSWDVWRRHRRQAGPIIRRCQAGVMDRSCSNGTRYPREALSPFLANFLSTSGQELEAVVTSSSVRR
jgi:hypothetical protein